VIETAPSDASSSRENLGRSFDVGIAAYHVRDGWRHSISDLSGQDTDYHLAPRGIYLPF